MKYASVIPLIGGETLAMEAVFGKRPEYMLSYSPFANNDQHIVKYYKDEVPYILLDQTDSYKHKKVDVINTVCPCAGLSSLSHHSSSDSPTNDWMVKTTKRVLEEIQPKVFWGENAPRLASKMGEPIVKKLRKIASDNGYTMMLYKTKSLLHGLSQVRDRTFYFFFKGDRIPVFPFISRPHSKIEDDIRAVKRDKSDPMSELGSKKKPSDDPFYTFVLEKMEGGISHKKFVKKIDKSTNAMWYIEAAGISYSEVAEWFKANGVKQNWIDKCYRIDKKLKTGKGIMRKLTELPKDYIGAFVGHYPICLAHPDEDRYLTIRECLSLMKMPDDFILQGGSRNLNHICQNVPVTTAKDMAQAVKDYLEGKLDTITAPFAIIDNKSQSIDSEVQLESLEKHLK